MSRFSINATELSNTDVNFVALVKRGANRIPFRITKSEDNDMINLHSIGQRMFKSEEPQPVAAPIAAHRLRKVIVRRMGNSSYRKAQWAFG